MVKNKERLQDLTFSVLESIYDYCLVYCGTTREISSEIDFKHENEFVALVKFRVTVYFDSLGEIQFRLDYANVKTILNSIAGVEMPNVTNLLNERLKKQFGKTLNF